MNVEFKSYSERNLNLAHFLILFRMIAFLAIIGEMGPADINL